MKKSIILLLGLVLLFAIPVFASTPENENAPAVASEDQQFIGLTTLSEEELVGITGNLDQQNGQIAEGQIEPPNNDIASGSSKAGAGSGGNYPYIPLGGID
ncbi:MAG: hypothetical protein NUV32_10590 [Exilispira sp.]|jgi:hypothetical protein|nr:hypothetical protein [Exilispira sp.]